jgi:O-antigen/teichoic acid export membrane protein
VAAGTGPARPPVGRLRFDASLTFASQASIGSLNFGAAVVVARALGPNGRGSVAVALAIVVGLVQLGSLGITAASPSLTARDGSLAGPLATAAVYVAIALGGLLAGLLLALGALGSPLLAGLTWTQLGVIAVAVPLALASLFLQSILLGQGRAVAYNAVQLAFALLSVAALTAVAVAGGLSLTLALVLLLGQYPLSAVASLGLLASSRPLRSLPGRELWRTLLGFGLRAYAGTVLSFLVIRLDLLLVNAYRGPRQAGFYSVAVAIAQAMYLLPAAIGVNILPRVARGSPAAATAAVFRIVALVYGGLCVLAAALTEPAVHLAFGHRFAPSVTMVYWLLPGVYCLGLLVILSSHFAGLGYPWRAAAIWAGGLGLNVAANMVLIPAYGTYMASITSSVTYVAVLGLHVRLFLAGGPGELSLRPRFGELRGLLAGLPRAAARRWPPPSAGR